MLGVRAGGSAEFLLNPLNGVMHLNFSNEVSVGDFHYNGRVNKRFFIFLTHFTRTVQASKCHLRGLNNSYPTMCLCFLFALAFVFNF